MDASGCNVSSLRDCALIQRICQQVVADIGVKVVGEPQCHRFDGPGGVTALYMLSESHLACHTYPEYGLATFNLYCCRERAAWDWQGMLSEMLDAKLCRSGSCREGCRKKQQGWQARLGLVSKDSLSRGSIDETSKDCLSIMRGTNRVYGGFRGIGL